MSVEISTPIASVVNSTLVEIGAVDMSVVVDNSTSKSVVVIPNSYVLSSSGIYTGAMSTNGIPSWLSDAITNSVTEGNLEYINILNDLRTSLDSLELGVNQNIIQIENTNLSMSSLEISIVSRLYGNDAAILHLDTTRVTTTEAQAISAAAIQSTFGVDASAYVGNIVSTYANANLATATSVELLVAEYNGLSASITSMEEVYAGVYQQWNGVGAPMIGMFKFVGDIQYEYLGGMLGENNDGWVRTDASAATTADQAVTWAAGASKLITAPDGSVTGWSFGDGSGVQSQFKVYADNFIIQGATAPIEYDNSAIKLPQTYEQISAPTVGMLVGDTWIDTDDSNKVYTYTSAGWKASVSNKTFAQTTQPTTGMITNDIWYDTDDNNKPYYYTGSAWSAIRDGTIAIAQSTADSKTTLATVQAQGYVLPSGVADAINNNTTTISGSKITTGTIYAAQLNVGAIYGKTINIDDTSNAGGTIFNGGTLGLFTTSVQQNGLAGVNSLNGGHGVAGVSTNSTSGAGLFGRGNYGAALESTNGAGQWGMYTSAKTYSVGGYFPFTGAHITYSPEEFELGQTVCAKDAWVIEINQTLIHTTHTTMEKDTRVVGVVSAVKIDIMENIINSELVHYYNLDKTIEILPQYKPYIDFMIQNNYKEISINSIGEGGILVSNKNGNITNGDYLVSDGNKTCMKQDDDIFHNYTVAKALESVDWSIEPSNTKMIACTYHSG